MCPPGLANMYGRNASLFQKNYVNLEDRESGDVFLLRNEVAVPVPVRHHRSLMPGSSSLSGLAFWDMRKIADAAAGAALRQ